MLSSPIIDVLCIGHAAYDLIFSVAQHPASDEKVVADEFMACGGGPAANAAVQVARLGLNSAFAGYLGQDLYGDKHLQELAAAGVNCDYIVRGSSPTPLSTILVKPNGQRALINFKGETQALAATALDFSKLTPKTVLFDGHEPNLSLASLANCTQRNIPTVLDAGSLHTGTRMLMQQVTYLVCSEKFACQFAGDASTALQQLAELAPAVVITLGERGLIWRRGVEHGRLSAYQINCVDSTGAGDAFHGAFAAALSCGLGWQEILRYASAAGSLCCTQMGARPGLADKATHQQLFTQDLPT